MRLATPPAGVPERTATEAAEAGREVSSAGAGFFASGCTFVLAASLDAPAEPAGMRRRGGYDRRQGSYRNSIYIDNYLKRPIMPRTIQNYLKHIMNSSPHPKTY